MSTYATPEQLRDAIIESYRALQEYKHEAKVSKREFETAVQKTDQYKALASAKLAVDDAREKLHHHISNDADLAELKEDAKYNADAVASAKATLGALLARQVMQSKNKSVDVGGEYPREVILKAVLGDEAPEQLPLFDE